MLVQQVTAFQLGYMVQICLPSASGSHTVLTLPQLVTIYRLWSYADTLLIP